MVVLRGCPYKWPNSDTRLASCFSFFGWLDFFSVLCSGLTGSVFCVDGLRLCCLPLDVEVPATAFAAGADLELSPASLLGNVDDPGAAPSAGIGWPCAALTWALRAALAACFCFFNSAPDTFLPSPPAAGAPFVGFPAVLACDALRDLSVLLAAGAAATSDLASMGGECYIFIPLAMIESP